MDGHPFKQHRADIVEKRRVSHIAHHRADGGRVHSDEAQDKKLFGRMIREHDKEHPEGKKAKHRRDRPARAHGGRVGKKGKASHVNVVVNTGQHPSPMPPPPAMAPPMPPPGPPAGLGAPPPGLGAGPPGMPPGGPMMPPRARGGRIESPKNEKPYRKGGKVRHRADGGEADEYAAPQGSAARAAQDGSGGVSAPQTTASGATVAAGMRRNPNASISADGKVHGFAHGGKIYSDGKTAKEPSAKALRAERADGGGVSMRDMVVRGRPTDASGKMLKEGDPDSPPVAVRVGQGMKRARGGGVHAKSGPAWEEGRKAGTHVQHSDALSVTEKNMNRPRVVTFAAGGGVVSFKARGGRVEAPQGVAPATKRIGGGGGGLGRREKAQKYGYGKPLKEVDGAR